MLGAMTSPRAPRTPRARTVLVGFAVLTALGGGLAALRHTGGGHAPRPHLATAAPAPVLAAVPRPSPSPTARRPVAVPHDTVPAAAPHRFTLSGAGFTIRARVCGMPDVRPLDPPGEQHHTVCWVDHHFGVAPGSHSATTYVLGHAWAPDPLEVLNKASSRATRDVLRAKAVAYDGIPTFPAPSLLGSHLTLTTAQGRLTYTVRRAFGVDKMKLGLIETIMNEHVAHRVVLITCAERHGRDYPYNIVAEAYLTSAERSAA